MHVAETCTFLVNMRKTINDVIYVLRALSSAFVWTYETTTIVGNQFIDNFHLSGVIINFLNK